MGGQFVTTNIFGGEGDWDFRISDLVKTQMEQIFNPCGEVRWAQLAKSTLLTSTLGPLGSFISSKVCSDAKGRMVCESNGKLPHLFIP